MTVAQIEIGKVLDPLRVYKGIVPEGRLDELRLTANTIVEKQRKQWNDYAAGAKQLLLHCISSEQK